MRFNYTPRVEACMPVVELDGNVGVEVKSHGLMFLWDAISLADSRTYHARFDRLTVAWFTANVPPGPKPYVWPR